MDLDLHVLHVNHHLRGADSDGDAESVRELACKLRLPFDLKEIELAPKGNLEEKARAWRYVVFPRVDGARSGGSASRSGIRALTRPRRSCSDCCGAPATTGLAAIRPVTSDGIVRPLIDVDRAEVEKYLRQRGISWREDATNATLDFARNRIRHNLIPQLTADWNPALEETLAHTAEISLGGRRVLAVRSRASGVAAFSTGWRRRARSVHGDLADLPLAAGRRLVRYAVELAAGHTRGLDFGHVTRVLELAARARAGAAGCKSLAWRYFGRSTTSG